MDSRDAEVDLTKDREFEMNGEPWVQHRFEAEVNGQIFRDALVMPKKDFKKLTDKQKESLKKERIDNHAAILANAAKASTDPESNPEDD